VDASLMDEESLQRYDVRLREKPGPTNSLGLVKFMFPNDHDIYLHDTPADHLFQRTTRTFSHGCVRVERPAEFAQHVLPDDWSQRRVREAMDADERKRVSLDHRLPVYLIYLTAWAEPDGAVHFRRDLYGHDPKLRAALDEPERRPASCARIDAFIEDLDRAAERDRGGWLAQLFSR
jgi:murein L,D-transpeptidase YcbB/YkuD